ncbi:hypothetical protein OSI51_08375 [Mycobacterium ulcerans]|nr:hypothetical protein [Mycobacterium ulcerans]MEB4135086.1 hypothetical protein [Mycobacterium ulcerans]MEB4260120.1 hypothetical protein [Mycobacterium ulcerans]MEB4268395.1 hypothetical protein [Mycobacterium ulcerans]
MAWRRSAAPIVAYLVVLMVAACSPAADSGSPPSSKRSTANTGTSMPALFYAKAGSLYVSDPAGTPGRKLTDGPADTQPAPSPDGTRVAYVHKNSTSDYGGELWVLDLAEDAPAGAPHRLVDPAALPPPPGHRLGQIVNPRWSPTGKQIAFLQNDSNGTMAGGLLIVAAADTGSVLSPPQRPAAADQYAWAPDGNHIAWANARSDVSPIDVNALEVGAASAPVAMDTNAYSMAYGSDGRSILFTNGDASGPNFTEIPFALRDGGIYSAAAPGGTGTDPAGAPRTVFARAGSYYSDLAALSSGELAFTETRSGEGESSKSLQVLDVSGGAPQTIAANVAAEVQGPRWGAGNVVAYLESSPGKPLVITDLDKRTRQQIDTGVDAFAWPPQAATATSGG